MHLTYRVIFLASGTSRTSVSSMTSTASTTSVASMTSTASIHQKTYRALCFYQPWHQHDLSWSLNVGLIVKNPLLQIKFCHPSERRLWWTGMSLLTKSKGQCSMSIANEHTDTYYVAHFDFKDPVNAT